MNIEALRESIMKSPHSWKGVGLSYNNTSEGQGFEKAFIDLSVKNGGLYAYNDKIEVIISLTGSDSVKCQKFFPDISLSWSEIYVLLGGDLRNVQHERIFGKHVLPVSASILIVEDEPLTSRIISSVLEPYGNVLVAGNAYQATAEYNVLRPDIVFLDLFYRNHDSDGFDVLSNLLSTNPEAYIVVVSANNNPATIFKALNLGAKGFICKPFKKGSFVYYLEKFADRKQPAL